MRYLVATLFVVGASALAAADETAVSPSAVSAAIDRGLAFLAADAMAWKNEHNCVSCHHASLVVWAMREAMPRGYKVDKPVLAELTTWIAESGDGTTSLARPDGIPKALNEKAVSLALARTADPQPDANSQQGLQLLLSTVKSDQQENGSWASWPDTRPPIFGHSDERATLAATLALLPAAATGDNSAIVARDKAMAWIAETKSDDDAQSMALRLVVWQRAGRPMSEWLPLAGRIRERQNTDGGWSQTSDMPSDAWATGQALYALRTRTLCPTIPRSNAAHAFLVRTQRDDGSWSMISRPVKPGGEGSKSLIPITAAGSAWAVLGLTRTR